MKTTSDKFNYQVSPDLTLHFRFPTIRQTKQIEAEFGKSDNLDGYINAINTILVGWSGEGLPMYTGSVEDVCSEIDVLYMRAALLPLMQEFEVELKKKYFESLRSSSVNSAATSKTSTSQSTVQTVTGEVVQPVNNEGT